MYFKLFRKTRRRVRIPINIFSTIWITRSNLAPQQQTQLDLTELTAQIQKHPDRPQDLYLLAEAYLKLGKLDEARQTITQLDQISAGDYRTQTGVGVLLARFRLYDDAISHFQNGVARQSGFR